MLPPKPPPFSWPPSCSYRLIGKKVFPPHPPTRPEPKRCDDSGARILFPLDNRSRRRRGDQDAAARPPLARLPPAQAVLYLRRFPLNVPTYAGSRGHGDGPRTDRRRGGAGSSPRNTDSAPRANRRTGHLPTTQLRNRRRGLPAIDLYPCPSSPGDGPHLSIRPLRASRAPLSEDRPPYSRRGSAAA